MVQNSSGFQWISGHVIYIVVHNSPGFQWVSDHVIYIEVHNSSGSQWVISQVIWFSISLALSGLLVMLYFSQQLWFSMGYWSCYMVHILPWLSVGYK